MVHTFELRHLTKFLMKKENSDEILYILKINGEEKLNSPLDISEKFKVTFMDSKYSRLNDKYYKFSDYIKFNQNI